SPIATPITSPISPGDPASGAITRSSTSRQPLLSVHWLGPVFVTTSAPPGRVSTAGVARPVLLEGREQAAITSTADRTRRVIASPELLGWERYELKPAEVSRWWTGSQPCGWPRNHTVDPVSHS